MWNCGLRQCWSFVGWVFFSVSFFNFFPNIFCISFYFNSEYIHLIVCGVYALWIENGLRSVRFCMYSGSCTIHHTNTRNFIGCILCENVFVYLCLSLFLSEDLFFLQIYCTAQCVLLLLVLLLLVCAVCFQTILRLCDRGLSSSL